jgi:FSR family fosmidomycin resistance protein-like MFS transporter
MDGKDRPEAANWPRIVVLSLAHFCHDIYTSFLSPLLPLLIEKFALTYTLAGFLSVMLRVPSLFNPLIGSLAEHTNLKWFVILSPSVTAIAMGLLGLAPGYSTVIVLLLITGLSSAAFHVPLPLLLARMAGSKVGTGMSLFQIGGELSRTAGPLLVAAVVSWWGMEGIFRLIPLGIGMSVLLYMSLKNMDGPAEVKHTTKNPIIKTVIKHRKTFAAIFGVLITKAFIASILVAYLPTYMTSVKDSSIFWAGATLSITQAAAIVGVIITGYVSDIIGRKKILFILTASAPIFMFVFLFSPEYFLIPALIMVGLFAFTSTPVILALVQDLKTDFPSIANGIYMTINLVLSSSVVLFVGKLSDYVGLENAFLYSCFLSFLGIPLLIFLPEI